MTDFEDSDLWAWIFWLLVAGVIIWSMAGAQWTPDPYHLPPVSTENY